MTEEAIVLRIQRPAGTHVKVEFEIRPADPRHGGRRRHDRRKGDRRQAQVPVAHERRGCGPRSEPTEARTPEPAPAPEQPRLEAPKAPTGMTFRDATEGYLAGHRNGWKNPKHGEQWEESMRRFVFPHIGDLPAADIDVNHVLAVLEAPVAADAHGPAGQFWSVRAETASRVRGRIESVLGWAKVREKRSGDNPARWKDNLDMALSAKRPPVEHHPALPYDEIGAFMAELRTRNGLSARALEFCVLTAARTGEVNGARWSEIDLERRLWIIPGARMKAGKEHRVPLTERCVEILNSLPRTGDLVFARPGGKKLSGVAMLAALKRMGRETITVHGFRSTFRDWASETTSHQHEVVEMALAHAVGNKVEAAYRRGDLFEKRRALMEDWASACGCPAKADEPSSHPTVLPFAMAAE